MSDIPKGLQRAATFRWWALGAAALLTVVTGVLVWVEVTDGTPPAPRAFVSAGAIVVWIGFFELCSTVFRLKRQAVRDARMEKKAERNTERILQAITTKRLADLADLLEPSETSARSINERR